MCELEMAVNSIEARGALTYSINGRAQFKNRRGPHKVLADSAH